MSTAHFSITGEFMTGQARQFWIERNFAKAFQLLDCLMGATREQHEMIISGRAKLVGINDLDFVADDWQPPKNYPSFYDALSQGKEWEELQQRRRDEAVELLTRAAKIEFDYASGEDSERAALLRARAVELIGEDAAAEILKEKLDELQDEENAKERAFLARLQTPMLSALGIDAVKAGMRGSDIKNPVLCKDMSSPSGWLLPDGKYYACGCMEHIGLATALLKEKHPKADNVGGYEAIAETYGWVKITRSLYGFACIGKKRPTQKQINALHDYAERHGRDYQEMIQLLPK